MASLLQICREAGFADNSDVTVKMITAASRLGEYSSAIAVTLSDLLTEKDYETLAGKMALAVADSLDILKDSMTEELTNQLETLGGDVSVSLDEMKTNINDNISTNKEDVISKVETSQTALEGMITDEVTRAKEGLESFIGSENEALSNSIGNKIANDGKKTRDSIKESESTLTMSLSGTEKNILDKIEAARKNITDTVDVDRDSINSFIETAKRVILESVLLKNDTLEFATSIARSVGDEQNQKYLEKVVQWNANIYNNVEAWFDQAEQIVSDAAQLNYIVDKTSDVMENFSKIIRDTEDLKVAYTSYLSQMGTVKTINDRISTISDLLKEFCSYMETSLIKDHKLQVANTVTNAVNAAANATIAATGLKKQDDSIF